MACVHFNLYFNLFYIYKRSSNLNTNIEYTYMTIIYDNINFYKQLSHNARIYMYIVYYKIWEIECPPLPVIKTYINQDQVVTLSKIGLVRMHL